MEINIEKNKHENRWIKESRIVLSKLEKNLPIEIYKNCKKVKLKYGIIEYYKMAILKYDDYWNF